MRRSVDWAPKELDLLPGGAPKLSELNLRDISLKRWNASFLSGLWKLVLADARQGLHLQQLFDYLRTCTALEHLSLSGIIFKQGTPYNVTSRIQLPSLASITIRNVRPFHAAPIVHSVDISNCTHWIFECDSDPWESPLVAALVDRMAPAFQVDLGGSLDVSICRNKVEMRVDHTGGEECGPILTVLAENSSEVSAAQWAMAALGTAAARLPVKLQLNGTKMTMRVTYPLLYDAPDVTELAVMGVKSRSELRTLLSTLSESCPPRTDSSPWWLCPKLWRFSISDSCAIDPQELRHMVEARASGPAMPYQSNSPVIVKRPVPITEVRVGGVAYMEAGRWRRIEEIPGLGANREPYQDTAREVGETVEVDDRSDELVDDSDSD